MIAKDAMAVGIAGAGIVCHGRVPLQQRQSQRRRMWEWLLPRARLRGRQNTDADRFACGGTATDIASGW